MQQSIADLKKEGLAEDVAVARAQAEVDALEQADLQGKFRDWFTGGVSAALEGDLAGFFENWLRDRAASGLEAALDEVADVLFDAFRGVLSSVIQSGSDGLGQAVASIFTGGAIAGVDQLGKGAAEAADALSTVLAASAADAASKVALQGAAASASAAKEAAIGAQRLVMMSKEYVAMSAVTQAAFKAAAALNSVAGSAGGDKFAGLFSSVLGAFGGSGGGYGGFGGFRASGGPINPGLGYVVGERGPEVVVPKVPSFVIPNGIGGGVNVTYVDRTTYHLEGTSEEIGRIKAFQRQDAADRRAQVIGIVREAIGRRQIGRG